MRGDLGRELAGAVKDAASRRASLSKLVRVGELLRSGDIDLVDGGTLDEDQYEAVDGLAAKTGDLVVLIQEDGEHYAIASVSDEGSTQPTWYGPYLVTASAPIAAGAGGAGQTPHGIPGLDPDKAVVSGHLKDQASFQWRASFSGADVVISFRNGHATSTLTPNLQFQIAVYP